ncbi:hypothetical protein [Companilactobacillus halodurans]|nr:hypothetical protein [Companilactobacillus halodurans]
MKRTRYMNVYKDKDANGKPFISARVAHNEAIKVKNDALEYFH